MAFRSACLFCGSKKIARIIDLGVHPFADTFIAPAKLGEPEPIYPLLCDLCQDCGQIQLSCQTKPEERYSLYDYSYTSSNSSFSRGHWDDYAGHVSEVVALKKNSFVVEVGSNDGYLAEQFKKRGCKVLGVDPSKYMASLAKKRKIKTIIDLFSRKTARNIIQKYGKVDLIVANNVFNHSDAPVDFVRAAYDLLAPSGTFVFESPYWYFGFKDKKFDQIYHEHVSYFSVKAVDNLFKKTGLAISAVEIVNYHGGSLRVFAKKKKDVSVRQEEIDRLIAEEEKIGLFSVSAYEKFMKNILSQRHKFLKNICALKIKGKSIIAVGAAAKGNTLLNFYRLDRSLIDFVTDASPYKQGKYTPLSRIPICGDGVFAKYKDVYALILSWNISDLIKNSLKKINNNIKFISLK